MRGTANFSNKWGDDMRQLVVNSVFSSRQDIVNALELKRERRSRADAPGAPVCRSEGENLHALG